MSTFSTFEPAHAKQSNKQDEVAFCLKCNCTWFEQFSVKQFKASHSAVIGQNVPPSNPYEFIIIRCVKCGEKYQPNILVGAQDQGTKLYNDFLDQLEEKTTKEEPAQEKK